MLPQGELPPVGPDGSLLPEAFQLPHHGAAVRGDVVRQGAEGKGEGEGPASRLLGELAEIAQQFFPDGPPGQHVHPAGEGLGRTTAFLSERTEIVYEREIPLAIQISTAKNDVLSYNPSYFFQPEEYEKLDYEHVYALTVTFSQEPLS